MTSTALALVTRDDDMVDHSDKNAGRAITATITGICVEGAISILSVFSQANTPIYFGGDRWVASDLMDDKYFPENQGRLARETSVFWFWGGPPSRLKWYRGTLQTLVEDRILCEMGTKGVAAVAECIGLDLTGVC
jgi:hypothetical protein